MPLDYPSILFFLAVNNLFIIVLFTYHYFFHQKQWYLPVFILGILFQTVALVLVGSRSILPFLYSVQVSNFFLISSFAITSFGLVSFDGKVRKNIIWLFIVFTILFYVSFLVVGHHDTLRIIIQIVASAFFYGIGAYYLFFNKIKYKFSRILSVVLLAYSVFQLFRAFIIYHIGPSYNFMEGSTIDNWYLVVSMFVMSASSIGFIMLLKEIDQKTIVQNNKRIEQDKLKLEDLNSTKDKLFSIIAHDLRSPFNSILGFSDLLTDHVEDFDVAKSKKYLGIINSSAQNTLVLLENLLDWAKSSTGQILLDPQSINISSIITEILEQSRSAAMVKGITLDYQPKEDEVIIYSDADILRTILRNLMTNAIKFTPTGGRVVIESIIRDDQLELSISDTGIGMNNDKLNTLFSISSNASTLGTSKEKGSGLGLVLCKEFVEKLGGRIKVESEEGKGSRFSFTLPLKDVT